ncbi:MAG: hypothetical protein QOE97_309 [Pseudonocardiales bacterium]|nr:hypothetical protein [Pseudonocardiales bacterium]
MTVQFSLFGAAATDPSPADLDGVLLGGGHWVRAGAAARLSVVVADRWRAEALADAFAVREVGGGEPIVDAETLEDARSADLPPGGLGVRTGFHESLVPAAVRWTRGAHEGPPADFALTAGGLRLWAVTSGRRDDVGYLLATAQPDGPIHLAGGAQLSRLGLAAVSIGPRGGPGWRVTSLKRLRRLAELLGEPPAGGEDAWP